MVLRQSSHIHSLENQFYKNMTANNDKILCVRYKLYIKIIQKSLQAFFHKIWRLDGWVWVAAGHVVMEGRPACWRAGGPSDFVGPYDLWGRSVYILISTVRVRTWTRFFLERIDLRFFITEWKSLLGNPLKNKLWQLSFNHKTSNP